MGGKPPGGGKGKPPGGGNGIPFGGIGRPGPPGKGGIGMPRPPGASRSQYSSYDGLFFNLRGIMPAGIPPGRPKGGGGRLPATVC